MRQYDSTLKAIKKYLNDCSTRDMHLIGTGDIEQLEEKLKEFYRVKYALCFSNATNALTTAVFSLDIMDTEVITSPLNYGASVSGLLYLGNQLVFSDVDKETNTLCILPDTIEKRINGKTSALLAVDFGGVPHDMFRLRKICDTYGLKYIADASQSFGAFINNQPAGRLADIWVISFTTGKTLFAGEGAAIMTDSDDLYEKIVWYSQHPYRQKRDISLQAYNEFSFLNGRISPLSAILANETFEISLKILKARQKRYLNLIQELNESGVTKTIDYERNNLLPTFFKLYLPWKSRQSKKKLVELLKQSGYNFTISNIEPIFKNEHFLLQFSKQFEKSFKTNCEDIGEEYFDLETTALADTFFRNTRL